MRRLLCLAIGIAVCRCGELSAQTLWTPVEVGAQWSALGLKNDSDEPGESSGLGAHVAVNLTRRVALTSEINRFPNGALTTFSPAGDLVPVSSATIQFATGIRATFVRREHVAFYGFAAPGLLHFTKTIVGYDHGVPQIGGATRFALDSGYGVSFYPDARWMARLELSGPLYVRPGAEIDRSDPGPDGAFLAVATPARVKNPWQLKAAVGYRPGVLRSWTPEREVGGRWEIGPAVNYSISTDAIEGGITAVRHSAIGAFASYRLLPHMDVDLDVDTYLQPETLATPFDGGRALHLLAGAKFGVREDAFGVFLKIRSGLITHPRAVASIDFAARTGSSRRVSFAALDLGGVLEKYVGSRFLVRLEAGDRISIFHSVSNTVDGDTFQLEAPPALHSVQMLMGMGLRF